MKSLCALLTGLSALFLAGCSNPGIVQLSPDTYLLTRTDRGGVFGNASKMKADVIREANEFAAKQGKVAIPLNTKETPMGVGTFASFDYQFRVVEKNDPEAKRTYLEPRADVVIEKTDRTSPGKRADGDSAKAPDLYTELTKLDELRKKGLLSDAEFEQQKQRLLSQAK